MNIPEALSEIAGLCLISGASPLTKYENCWEERLDEKWEIAMNGHKTPKRCSHGIEVPPFSVYVQYNGWPAGILDPTGGIIASGESANEQNFIAAIRKRKAELTS